MTELVWLCSTNACRARCSREGRHHQRQVAKARAHRRPEPASPLQPATKRSAGLGCETEWEGSDLLKCPKAASGDLDALQRAVDHDLGLLDVRLEGAILLGCAQRPPNTVLISNVAAEHLFLAAELTLGHEMDPSPQGLSLDKYLTTVA